MSTNRTDKELAFLHDLYFAPDWGERFAALADEHVVPLQKGRILYVTTGTGGQALAMLGRAGEDVTLVGVDESEERLVLARAKAAALGISKRTEFHQAQPEELDFDDARFDLVIGDASLIAPERLPEMVAEMVRVAVPGGGVALSVATQSSFGEFFSIYWEALLNADLADYASTVERLIVELPAASDIETLFAREGVGEMQSWTSKEEFTYASGEEFVNSPLITSFLLQSWLEPLPDEAARGRVRQEVVRIIDDEQSGSDFVLSVKATLVVGRKPEA